MSNRLKSSSVADHISENILCVTEETLHSNLSLKLCSSASSGWILRGGDLWIKKKKKKRFLEDPGNQMLERFICVSTNRVHVCKINPGKGVKGYQADVRRVENNLSCCFLNPITALIGTFCKPCLTSITFDRRRSCFTLKMPGFIILRHGWKLSFNISATKCR